MIESHEPGNQRPFIPQRELKISLIAEPRRPPTQNVGEHISICARVSTIEVSHIGSPNVEFITSRDSFFVDRHVAFSALPTDRTRRECLAQRGLCSLARLHCRVVRGLGCLVCVAFVNLGYCDVGRRVASVSEVERLLSELPVCRSSRDRLELIKVQLTPIKGCLPSLGL